MLKGSPRVRLQSLLLVLVAQELGLNSAQLEGSVGLVAMKWKYQASSMHGGSSVLKTIWSSKKHAGRKYFVTSIKEVTEKVLDKQHVGKKYWWSSKLEGSIVLKRSSGEIPGKKKDIQAVENRKELLDNKLSKGSVRCIARRREVQHMQHVREKYKICRMIERSIAQVGRWREVFCMQYAGEKYQICSMLERSIAYVACQREVYRMQHAGEKYLICIMLQRSMAYVSSW